MSFELGEGKGKRERKEKAEERSKRVDANSPDLSSLIPILSGWPERENLVGERLREVMLGDGPLEEAKGEK